LLLTLFALVGVTFVFYADAAATSARLRREAESLSRPDAEPELLLAHFLGQLIFDVDDETGLGSALRSHSLARLLYGWNAEDPASNIVPFNGTGRLHEPFAFPAASEPVTLDGYHLINYTCFRKPDGSLLDGFLRDPERLGHRTKLADKPGPYGGGFNAPYTYPDLNNLFLAAVKADGTVLLPSFHRPWTGFGPLDPANPNWYDRTKPWLKYLVLRPRPADMGPGFPAPEDLGGDVKNLIGGPGGNDSVWLDLDFPVQTTLDGRKYKPLFAPLIVDLDNRVNVNVHGNARGESNRHLSNQGWGPWEVNPQWVVGDEARYLLLGSRKPPQRGRYGADGKPGSRDRWLEFGPAPHVYAQTDFDGSDEGPGGRATGPITLPGPGAPLSCFPTFPAGYGNGATGRPGTEGWEHSRLSDPFRPTGDDRAFAAADLEALLRQGDTGSEALTSALLRLCPTGFRDPRARRLVTTHGWDLDRPGIMPWLFDRDASGYQPPLDNPGAAPRGPTVPFPALDLRTTAIVPEHSEFRTPGADPTNPAVDWRSAVAVLGRVNLNRFLPPYPHQGRGTTPASYSRQPLVDPGGRFDAGDVAVREQFLAAQVARQRLADDVYRRLLAVTGPATPVDPVRPTDAELAPRRWLAQLAANVVDFLDEDDVSTPFNFYTAEDAGTPAFDGGAVSSANPELPRYWVFGTELPRVVVNEALTEYQLPPRGSAGRVEVRTWVELFNPLPGGPTPAGAQVQDGLPVPVHVPAVEGRPGYAPYRVVIANTNLNPGGPLLPRPGGDNVLGTPDVVRGGTTDTDFTLSAPAGIGPQGYFLLGPPGLDARGTLAPPRVPAETPWVQSINLAYSADFAPPATLVPDDRPGGITVLLRRLANPHLPFDPRPVVGGLSNPLFNPYLTIDFLEGVPLNNASNPTAVYASRGKCQPYAADLSQVAPQEVFLGSPTGHTLGRLNQPTPPTGHYDWLVHLDRALVSPAELLHVSGCAPWQLTHRFLSRDIAGGPVRPFNHRGPWFDEDTRLYRVFELLETRLPGSWTEPGGRVPGKINLNTIWDPETLLALCDPQPGNHFTAADVYNPRDPRDPNSIFGRLMKSRTPGGVPGPEDRPFLGMAVGRSPGPGDDSYPPGGDPLFPRGSGLEDTLFRAAITGGGKETPRLFGVSASHPFLQNEVLTKLFNNVTTRSNVFAVWLTVGFFEVTDDTTRPVKLGAEIGRAEGRQVRHRTFAVVDRTNLAVFALRSRSAVAVAPEQPFVDASVIVDVTADLSENGRPWTIRPGSALTVDEGEEEETVGVTAVTPRSFTARFHRPHAKGFRITLRGNPGPWPRFNPAAHPELVPYFSIID
jgi:hypothetical protein